MVCPCRIKLGADFLHCRNRQQDILTSYYHSVHVQHGHGEFDYLPSEGFKRWKRVQPRLLCDQCDLSKHLTLSIHVTYPLMSWSISSSSTYSHIFMSLTFTRPHNTAVFDLTLHRLHTSHFLFTAIVLLLLNNSRLERTRLLLPTNKHCDNRKGKEQGSR